MAYAHITEFDFGDDRNTVNFDAPVLQLEDTVTGGGAGDRVEPVRLRKAVERRRER